MLKHAQIKKLFVGLIVTRNDEQNKRQSLRPFADDYGLNHSHFRDSISGREFLSSAALAAIASIMALIGILLFYSFTSINEETPSNHQLTAESQQRDLLSVGGGKVHPPEPAVLVPNFEPVPRQNKQGADGSASEAEPVIQNSPEEESIDQSATEPVRANGSGETFPPIIARIAIVIDDLGMNRAMNRRIAALTGPYNLSYLPYAPRLREQTREALLGGHELLVHLPMEPDQAEMDPGPNALLTSQTLSEVSAKLGWNLDQFHGFVGVNNHMGSRFTEDRSKMQLVLNELNKRGLYFLDSRTSPRTKGVALAMELGIPWTDRDIFLDNERDETAIEKQFSLLESIAIRRGSAVAIGHPYGVTLDVLERWEATLASKGIALVPVSSLLKQDPSVTMSAQSPTSIARDEQSGVGQE